MQAFDVLHYFLLECLVFQPSEGSLRSGLQARGRLEGAQTDYGWYFS